MNNKIVFYKQKLGILISIVFLISFSGLYGFIPFGEFIFIPVIVSAYFLGIKAGIITSLIFGVISMWQSAVTTSGELNHIFSMYRSGDMVKSAILNIAPRFLYGLLTGLIFFAVKKIGQNRCGVVVMTTYFLELFQTVFLFLFVGLLFPESNITYKEAIGKIFEVKEVLFSSCAAIIMFYLVKLSKNKNIIEMDKLIIENRNEDLTRRFSLEGFAVAGIVFLTNLLLTNHLNNTLHISSIKTDIELINIKDIIYASAVMQYLIGNLAVSYLIGKIVTYYRIHSVFKVNGAEVDVMTGLYTKASALKHGQKILDEKGKGFFIIIDIDKFKKINDSFGHLIGDRIITSVAFCLQEHFSDIGYVSRFGGDEFSVLLKDINEEEMLERTKQLVKSIKKIPLNKGEVTCSIGISAIDDEVDFNEVYKKADKMLYVVKNGGRNNIELYDKYREIV